MTTYCTTSRRYSAAELDSSDGTDLDPVAPEEEGTWELVGIHSVARRNGACLVMWIWQRQEG